MADSPLLRVGSRALKELEALVGCPAEGVSGIRETDEGWLVLIDVLELERTPATTDVMALYEVTMNGDGHVSGYRRVKRYLRSQVED
jgi:gas vesicle protein GvpO